MSRRTYVSMIGLAALIGCSEDLGMVQMDPDDELEPGILCKTELDVTGTVAKTNPPDPEGGCDPVGTWTLEVALGDPTSTDCTDAPTLGTYVYVVTELPEGGYEYAYPADPASEPYMRVRGAGGDCAGTFTHMSADGLVEHTFSVSETDGTIVGGGVYQHLEP
jgi:hypothetical protein